MKKWLILCLGILLVLNFGILNAVATKNVDDLEDQKDNLEQNIKDGQKTIESLDSKISDIQSNIEALETQMSDVATKIETYGNNLVAKEAEISATEGKIQELINQKEQYYAQAKDRIQVMYEYGNTAYIEVLLESKDASDFFSRMEYLNKVLEFDSNMFSEMAKIESDLEAQQAQLESEKVELEHVKAESEIEKKNMETLVASKNVEVTKFSESKESLKKEIEMWKDEQKSIDAQIKKMIADSLLQYDGGKVDWPVAGYYEISSEFGKRTHPVYGYESYHTGIDIPAPYGTSIKAAASGKVIMAGWSKAYGNYILINHGSGWVTQYGHCSKVLVAEGDVVVRGDVIAKVGSTGWSTGNHLHFGVQINGEWVNPVGKSSK